MSEIVKRLMPGDWWMLGTTFHHFVADLPSEWRTDDYEELFPTAASIAGGMRVWVRDLVNGDLGLAEFTGSGGQTTVTVETTPNGTAYWSRALACLEDFAKDAQRNRRQIQPTLDEAIERYYRANAAGQHKVTLRMIADDTGLSYEALRKHKQRYDAAGKWGSKRGKSVS